MTSEVIQLYPSRSIMPSLLYNIPPQPKAHTYARRINKSTHSHAFHAMYGVHIR